MHDTPTPWPRAILLVDMNAFFAAVEQRDFPALRGRPVAVTNGLRGTCVITSSYEARAAGVRTGMRLPEAKRLCPGLVQRPARPRRYARISTRIMDALTVISPDIEVFSVDEAFLDLTHCQRLHGSPERMARMAVARVHEASGLPCSVGLSGSKAAAKFAAKLEKPNGFTVIPPHEMASRLEDVPVTELCGVKAGIGGFLARHGAYTCGEVARLPPSVLERRFGALGLRVWLTCRGEDPQPVLGTVADPKSMGHGKVLAPNTTDPDILRTWLHHMAEKVGDRLRRHHMHAGRFLVGLRTRSGYLGGKYRSVTPTDDGRVIRRLCDRMLETAWGGEGVDQVQVTALDPVPGALQLDLFQSHDPRRNACNAAVDRINERYGEFTVHTARLHGRSDMPNVIAPAWKPFGHRQTIPGRGRDD